MKIRNQHKISFNLYSKFIEIKAEFSVRAQFIQWTSVLLLLPSDFFASFGFRSFDVLTYTSETRKDRNMRIVALNRTQILINLIKIDAF